MLKKARKQGKNPQSLGITGFSDFMDLKGIEPSNLTDANRALSQLSYKPVFTSKSSLFIIA